MQSSLQNVFIIAKRKPLAVRVVLQCSHVSTLRLNKQTWYTIINCCICSLEYRHIKFLNFNLISFFLIPVSQPGYSVFSYVSLESESESEVAQSYPTLCDPVDCSPPGSSIHGILQARILEWVAISFSMGSSWPRDWTQVSRIAGRRFNLWATREALRSSRHCI